MRAIDFHVHLCDARVTRAWAGEPADYERFFRGKLLDEDLDATAQRYRVFPDMWSVRTLLLRKAAVPPLANERFYFEIGS